MLTLFKNIAEILTKESHAAYQSLQQTLACTKLFAINIENLRIFFEFYDKLKKGYTHGLVAQWGQKRFDTLNSTETMYASVTIFDEKRAIKKLQDKFAALINKQLHLAQNTPAQSLSHLYYDLLQKILKCIPGEGIDLTSILKNQAAQNQMAQNDSASLAGLFKEFGIIIESKSDKKTGTEDIFFSDEDDEQRQEEPATPLIPPHEQAAKVAETFTAQEIQTLNLVGKKQRPHIHEIKAILGGLIPYTIELFNAKSLVQRTTEMCEAHKAFHDCAFFTEADRVKVLFALTDQIRSQNQVKIKRDAYGLPSLEYNDGTIDSSVIDRLNINHLFTRAVDRYLHACGIVESKGDLVQVSIPGKITFADGSSVIGFFQYSFIKQNWTLIHRCFVNYDANIGKEHISTPLRQALLDFLKKDTISSEKYNKIIRALEKIVTK